MREKVSAFLNRQLFRIVEHLDAENKHLELALDGAIEDRDAFWSECEDARRWSAAWKQCAENYRRRYDVSLEAYRHMVDDWLSDMNQARYWARREHQRAERLQAENEVLKARVIKLRQDISELTSWRNRKEIKAELHNG